MQRLAGGTIENIKIVIIKIWKSYIKDDTSEDNIKKMIEDRRGRRDRFILIYHRYKPVGFIAYNMKYGKGHIAAIAIEPEYRRTGNGKRLLDIAEKELKQAEFYEVILEARMDNTDAITFYEKSGYTVIQRLDNYYRDCQGVQLGKQLS